MIVNHEKKLNILLVYPNISKFERYSSSIGESGGKQIPLGIFYLASFLRKDGFTVRVIDAEAQNFSDEEIVQQAISFNAKVVGISTTTVAFHKALQLGREIKNRLRDVTLVVGGPHISSNCHNAMRYGVFDIAIMREGEETLLELVEKMAENQPITDVQGIAYMRDDELVTTPERMYIQDINTLPLPAYDLIPDIRVYSPPPSNYKKSPVANIITSRGCPNKCTFCDTTTFGRNVRFRDSKNIAAEIDYLVKKYGVQEIAFVDDTFTLRKQRIYDLFNVLTQNNLEMPWTCMARINSVDYDLLKFMHQNGCWHISFGIESGDQGILSIIKKNNTLDKIREKISMCKEIGILTKGFFIVGHPGETLETIEKTIQFALELPLDDIVVTINTPLPGSYQFDHAEEYGTLTKDGTEKCNYWNPVFIPNGLTEEILLKKHREFYRRFYLRPRIIWRYVNSFRSKSGMRRMVSVLKSSRFLFGA